MLAPALDHVVVDAREHLDEAEKLYKALGFTLTARGHHTLGSSNHLAMFGTNYLELLGYGTGGAMRPELELFPAGLNGLVFKAHDADASFQQAHAAGMHPSPVGAFSRPVTIDGHTEDARFRTTHLPPAETGIGRVYFCEHQTPDLVWRPEWQAHANGAREIVEVIVAAFDPLRRADLFARLFGEDAVTREVEGASLELETGRIRFVPVSEISRRFGAAAPDPAGRTDFLAALVIRTRSASAVAQSLRGLEGLESEKHRIMVPAKAAMNTTLLFEDEHAA